MDAMQIRKLMDRAKSGDRQAAEQIAQSVRADPMIRQQIMAAMSAPAQPGPAYQPEATDLVTPAQAGPAAPAPGALKRFAEMIRPAANDQGVMPMPVQPVAVPRDTTQLPVFSGPDTMARLRGIGQANRFASGAARSGMSPEELAAQEMAQAGPTRAPPLSAEQEMAGPTQPAATALTPAMARTNAVDYGNTFARALAATDRPGPETELVRQTMPMPLPAQVSQPRPAAAPALAPTAAMPPELGFGMDVPALSAEQATVPATGMTPNGARTRVGDYGILPSGATNSGGMLEGISDDALQNLLRFGLATMAAGGRPGVTPMGAIGEGGLAAITSMEQRKERADAKADRAAVRAIQERGVANQEQSTRQSGEIARAGMAQSDTQFRANLDQRAQQFAQQMDLNRKQLGLTGRQVDIAASAQALREWEVKNPAFNITPAGDHFIALNPRDPTQVKVLSGADGQPLTKGVTDEKAMELALQASKIGGSVTSEKKDPITGQTVGYQTTYDPEKGTRAATATLGALGKGDLAKRFGGDQASPAAGADAPPVEGARRAQDGKWYVPDPARPGKYLMVQN